MKLFRLNFEDHGQDFLSFLVSDTGIVLLAQPFQGWPWVGATVLNLGECEMGSLVQLHQRPTGGQSVSKPFYLKYYPLASVERDVELLEEYAPVAVVLRVGTQTIQDRYMGRYPVSTDQFSEPLYVFDWEVMRDGVLPDLPEGALLNAEVNIHAKNRDNVFVANVSLPELENVTPS